MLALSMSGNGEVVSMSAFEIIYLILLSLVLFGNIITNIAKFILAFFDERYKNSRS
jgi:hypothetical protein